MSDEVQENVVQETQNAKELNFRALEAKYERQLQQERQARLDAERIMQERQNTYEKEDEEDSSDPYVDHKRLDKKLAKFGEQTKKQTQSEIQRAVNIAIKEERQQNWIRQNPDFEEIIDKYAEKFALQDPDLAETILQMPEGFERKKLVYHNIKAKGLHKPPEEKKSGIQSKVDANRRNPGYQPSGISPGPFNQQADFSPAGQKQAYEKMQALKNNLRLS